MSGVNRTGQVGWPKGKKREPNVHVGMHKPRGSHNPKREEYENIIVEAMGGEHPLQALARLARESERDGDKTLAVVCYKELANYVAPKLKSIEVKQDQKDIKPITIIISEEGQKSIEENREEPKRVDNLIEASFEIVK